MRAVYEFGKKGRLRFISHLDLQRFMMRALRRTDLPVAYSQGFNPHPQISFASALAMGWTSDVEIVDIKLTAPVEADHALEQLRAALPPDMPVHTCRLVDDKHPAYMAMLTMADYRIGVQAPDPARFDEAVDAFLSADCLLAMRKTKSSEKEINVRPLVKALTREGDILCARLMLTPDETLKPDLMLEAIAHNAGLEGVSWRFIDRTALLGLNDKGEARPIVEL